MRNYVFLLYSSFVAFTASYALAQPERPTLITESFIAARDELSIYDQRRLHQDHQEGNALLWYKTLRLAGVDAHPPQREAWSYSECNYDTALAIWRELHQSLGSGHPYLVLWAKRQDNVFSACDTRNATTMPAMEEDSSYAPARAPSDRLYQQASWHFYRQDYAEALPLYQQIAKQQESPMRPYAAYMEMRTLAYLNRQEEAYLLSDTILKDNSLASIHAITKNYRFILMNRLFTEEITPALAKQHMLWLLGNIRIPMIDVTASQQVFEDYADSLAQLDNYFPLHDSDSKSIDWWLVEDNTPSSPKMQAVKELAVSEEIVDWMQASWAYNVFDTDWLWSLHQVDSPYWKQNSHIVSHAWQRYQAGDGLEWLEIALSRAHPLQDTQSTAMLEAARPWFKRDWQQESREYRLWLMNIWRHSVRLLLGMQEYDKVYALFQHYPEMTKLIEPQRYSGSVNPQEQLYAESIRWLVYHGEAVQARRLLTLALAHYPESFLHWRVALAENWESTLVAAKPSYGYSAHVDNQPIIWEKLANLLPGSQLHQLALDNSLDKTLRQNMALASLTRAILLKDDTHLRTYALTAARLHPAIRDTILSATTEDDVLHQYELLLDVPRLRPVPFTLSEQWIADDDALAAREIDVYNHNDNNWWCQVRNTDLQDVAFDAMRITPSFSYRVMPHFFIPQEEVAYQQEVQPYLEKQRAILTSHPIQAQADKEELRKLEAIPSAPRYLTEYAIAQERWNRWKFWRSDEAENRSAALLHHAIRTTRYGCQRDGSHADYSKEAFRLLHRDYGQSQWAKATPYWFSCQHFREGCKPDKAENSK